MDRISLSRATLPNLPPGVSAPRYEPGSVRTGIVHLGFGGFHRAHMARYTHDLMQVQHDALRWGIVGAGLLPSDEKMQRALAPQDGLYTLVERSGQDETVSVIAAAPEFIYAAQNSQALLSATERSSIKIVSLTVTEHGYCLNPATKRLDLGHGSIAADLVDPERPKTAVAIIAEAYRRRMTAEAKPFTALSCDNIQHNGDVLKAAVVDYASARDMRLADWIQHHGRFPNTMVDRITPATRSEDIADLAARYGVIDNWPVFSETFTQWVIEDDFADERPSWEDVGAQFVHDVSPYEFMKLRLLNASHLAIAGLGRLMGFRFIHQAMQNDGLCRYMQTLMDRETGPTLLAVPGVDLAIYKATLVKRFANPVIMDTVERVNTDAPVNYLLDPIRDRLKGGGGVALLSLALAAWLRRVRGVDEQGAPIDVRHPLSALLREKAIEGGADPGPLLGIDALFGDLGYDKRLVAEVSGWLKSIYEIGTAGTVDKALRSGMIN